MNEDIKTNNENRMKTEIKYSLGELIDGKNLNKLKTEVEKRERYKEKLGVINEQKFRTNYALKPKIQELKEILNYKKIKGDKLELIKYIQTHGHITDLFYQKARDQCQTACQNSAGRTSVRDRRGGAYVVQLRAVRESV